MFEREESIEAKGRENKQEEGCGNRGEPESLILGVLVSDRSVSYHKVSHPDL